MLHFCTEDHTMKTNADSSLLNSSSAKKTITLPAYLYRRDPDQQQQTVEWSYHSGNATPDYAKALQNKPWWKKQTSEAALVPKILIITDWANKVLHSGNHAVLAVLEQLLSENFMIYLKQNKKLIKVNIPCLNHIRKEKEFPIEYMNKHITTPLAQHLKVDPDDLFFLDDYELQLLIQEKPDYWNLNLIELIDLHPRHEKMVIQDFIENNNRPKSLQLTVFGENLINQFNAIAQEIHLAKKIIDFDGIYLNNLQQIEILINKKNLTINKLTLQEKQFPFIKTIMLEDIVFDDFHIFENFINLFPKLEILKLCNITINRYSADSIHSLPPIHAIQIDDYSSIDIDLILLLVQHCKTTQLSLKKYTYISTSINTFSGLIPLEKLEISDSILENNILSILHYSSNLQCLILDNNTFIDIENNIHIDVKNINKLNQLAHLKFFPSLTSNNFLVLWNLFKHMFPNLKIFMTSSIATYASLSSINFDNLTNGFFKIFNDLFLSFPTLVNLQLNHFTIDKDMVEFSENMDLYYIDNISSVNFKEKPQYKSKKQLSITPNAITPVPAPQLPCPAYQTTNALTRTPNSGKFVFDPQKNTKDQEMIIQKIAQYITIYRKDKMHLIPGILGGICAIASNRFVNIPIELWDKEITVFQEWNAKEHTLTADIIHTGDSWISHIEKYHNQPNYFLGNALESFLGEKNEALEFTNYKHQICIKPFKDKTWYVYEPNNPNGYFQAQKENLPTIIRTQLGSLVCISQSEKPAVEPIISCINSFINDGGLILLRQIMNLNELHIQQLLISPENILLDTLSTGLRVRSINGHPAWLLLLRHDPFNKKQLAKLTFDLLHMFYQKDAIKFDKELKESVSALTPKEIKEYLNIILSLQKQQHFLIDILCNLLRTSPLTHYYENKLKIWELNQEYINNLSDYCNKIFSTLAEKSKPQLIQFNQDEEIESFSLHMQLTNKSNRNIYIAESVEDLIVLSPFIQSVDNNRGTIYPGPGGNLYNFINENNDTKPLLIIHYNTFKSAEEFVRAQRLLSRDNPNIDGIPLPPGTSILGLVNSNNNHYKKEYFIYFDTHICPFSAAILNNELSPKKISQQIPEKFHFIELYQNNMNWEEKLLGKWKLQPDGFYFHPGKLENENVLQSGLPIVFNNPPNNAEFHTFWKKAFARKYININGNKIPLHADTTLHLSEGYHWEKLLNNIDWQMGFSESESLVLNPYVLEQFFKRQDAEIILPGYLEEYQNNALTVNLTRNLDKHSWAKFLKKCAKFSVKITIHCAPDILLAADMAAHIIFHNEPAELIQPLQHTILYDSTDVDATVASLCEQEDKTRIIINISDCEPEDLLPLIDATFDDKSCQFIFKKPAQPLKDALNNNKTVILYGQFSKELIDALFPLILTRSMDCEAPGNLFLITETPNIFPGVSCIYSEDHSKVRQPFFDEFPQLLAQQSDVSFAQLRAMANYLRIHPEANPEDAWIGLLDAPPVKKLSPFDSKNSALNAKIFLQQRIDSLLQAASNQPVTVLTGFSGVGKTTLIKQLQTFLGPDWTLFQGLENLDDCLKNTARKNRIFFLDEANMLQNVRNPHTALAQFEGLFHSPPGILTKSGYVYIEEDGTKLLVFMALNPENHLRGERKTPEFLIKHGNCVLIDPLSLDVLYESVLKTVFENTVFQEYAIDVSQLILQAYSDICASTTEEIALSPRELQMMATMTLAWMNKFQDITQHYFQNVAKYFIYKFAAHTVPEKDFHTFTKQYKFDINLAPITNQDPRFLLTDSRKSIWNYVNNWIDLQKMRVEQLAFSLQGKLPFNDAQICGGIGGLILQGPPQTGKMSLVEAILYSQKYVKIAFDKPLPANKFRYCIIPPALEIEQKIKYLLFAFHAGAITIIPQLNASCLLESVMNALLMGKTPEGDPAENPGFMMIGLQHPAADNKHLQVATAAFERRTNLLYMPDYPPLEIQQILIQSTHINKDLAASLKDTYLHIQNHAPNQQLRPNLHHLLNLAEEIHTFFAPPTNKTKARTNLEPLSHKRLKIHPVANNGFFQAGNADGNNKVTQSTVVDLKIL